MRARRLIGLIVALGMVLTSQPAVAAPRQDGSAGAAPAMTFAQATDGPCAATSRTDATEGGTLDIVVYAGMWRCGSDVLEFTFVTTDTWTTDALSEMFVRIDTDGDITNGCAEADYILYARNSGSSAIEDVPVGLFRSPSCDALENVGVAIATRPDSRRLVVTVSRALLGSPTVIGHYGSLAGVGEDNSTADYAPDTGRVVLDLRPFRDPESVALCIPDEIGDVVARDADGNSTLVDAPPFDLTEVCTWWGRDVMVDVTIPALDLEAAGPGFRLSLLVSLDEDEAAERILRATWDGLRIQVQVTDESNAQLCEGRALVVRPTTLRVGDIPGDCLAPQTQVGISPGVGRLVDGVTTFDRAGPGRYTTLRRAAPFDPSGTGAEPDPASLPDPVTRPQDLGLQRIAGPARVETSVAVSTAAWPDEGAAAVVLARQDVEADALAGAALATAVGGPLLLTTSSQVPDVVATELRRLLAPGARVYALGGSAALADQVLADVQQLGFGAVRLAGPSRVETGVAVAEEAARILGGVQQILVADAFEFQWALIAGAAAGGNDGVVLTTAPSGLSPQARAFIDANPEAVVTAIGPGATRAVPGAASVDVGGDPFATSAAVAERFFAEPTSAVVASGEAFPDGLGGGALAGSLGVPLLLSAQDALPDPVASYLETGTWTTISMLGGEAALSTPVATALARYVR